MKKWDRSLNTSKREQGITTPPAPQNKKRRKKYFGLSSGITEILGKETTGTLYKRQKIADRIVTFMASYFFKKKHNI